MYRVRAESCLRAASTPPAPGAGEAWRASLSTGLPLRITVGSAVAVDLASVDAAFDKGAIESALAAAGYPTRANPGPRNDALIVLAGVLLGILSAMTYGQVAAILVEPFPARIRYTSLIP